MSVSGLLDGKIAIITGGASGVGKAAVTLFMKHGAKVIAGDVDADGLSALQSENPGIVTQRCDVSNDDEVAALVGVAVQHYGRLDVIYNNAGIGSPTDAQGKLVPLEESNDGLMGHLFGINAGGVFHGCKHAIRRFREQGGGGVIVNTASVAGLVGFGGVLYGGTKGAVVAMTRALAIEVAPLGIRVNSVCPAGMITNFGRKERLADVTPEMVETYGKLHPLGRPIDPLDCASAALFLASDLASNITGVNLPVDGGYCAR